MAPVTRKDDAEAGTTTTRVVRFPEYERAASELMFSVVHELMRCHDGFLALLPRIAVADLPSEPAAHEGNDVGAIRPLRVELTFALPTTAILNTDSDEWVAMLDKAARDGADSLVPQIFAHLSDITAATGQIVESRGPISNDSILDMFEKMAISFDKDGAPELPTAVVGPETMEHIRNLPAPTPAQEARLAEILRRKKQEFDAGRRVRKLDRDS